jgi:hypothetical protein
VHQRHWQGPCTAPRVEPQHTAPRPHTQTTAVCSQSNQSMNGTGLALPNHVVPWGAPLVAVAAARNGSPNGTHNGSVTSLTAFQGAEGASNAPARGDPVVIVDATTSTQAGAAQESRQPTPIPSGPMGPLTLCRRHHQPCGPGRQPVAHHQPCGPGRAPGVTAGALATCCSALVVDLCGHTLHPQTPAGAAAAAAGGEGCYCCCCA